MQAPCIQIRKLLIFSPGDLANILQNATEAPASAFKARGIPEALKVVELMGIQQARSWGTCSVRLPNRGCVTIILMVTIAE
jgi:hypothetical protein